MYIPIEKLKKEVPDNMHNKWAIKMLEFIANDMWWEDTETNFFLDFFKDIVDEDIRKTFNLQTPNVK